MMRNPMIPEPGRAFLSAGAFVVALLLGGSAGAPAFAAMPDPPKCEEGKTYNEQTQKCEQTGSLEDDMLIRQGRALALAGHYENALEALMAVRNKTDSTVLTYIGYATRKLGKVDEGIAWYHKALVIDPDNIYTHEYLGEGYVAAGRIDLAEQELAKLEALCGKGCEQYEALSAAIAGEPESWGGG
jgi:tetratricopeptide (TPR) repeat protein